MKFPNFYIYFFLRSVLILGDSSSTTKLSESDLLVTLTSEERYNKYLIPHFYTDEPINVTVSIKIISIGDLHASDMEYRVGMYMRMMWMDERLSFHQLVSQDPDKYRQFAHLKDLDVHPNFLHRIWQPDPTFTNYLDGRYQDLVTPSKMLRIYKNGTVLYSSMLTLSLSCHMNLRRYPMDIQRCYIELESFGYRTKNLRFLWYSAHRDPVKIVEKDLNMPQFILLVDKTCATRCQTHFITGNFSCLRVELYFARTYSYHLLQIYCPSILIVTLSWISFWINPDAIPGRVTVGVTSVLTMTTQSAGSRDVLPPVSYVKALDVWKIGCLTFVFAALLEFAYVNTLREEEKEEERRRQDQPHASPVGNRRVLTVDGADDRSERAAAYSSTEEQVQEVKLSEFASGATNGIRREDKSTVPARGPTPPGGMRSRSVDSVSKVVFPLSFVVFNVLYWVYYLLLFTDDTTCRRDE